MRDIIYHVAISMDGYIAHKDGSTDGFLEKGDHVQEYLDSLKEYHTVIMGKNTYTYAYQFGLKPGELAYPWMDHFIVSKTLVLPSTSSIHLIQEEVVEKIIELKKTEGSPIYLCGGGNLAHQLYEVGLIDQVILKVNPIFFGDGISMFSGRLNQRDSWKLEDCRRYESGVIKLTYTKIKN